MAEKVFAGVYGSYGHLEQGFIKDGLIELTGGVCEKLAYPLERAVITNYLADLTRGRVLMVARKPKKNLELGLRANSSYSLCHFYSNGGIAGSMKEVVKLWCTYTRHFRWQGDEIESDYVRLEPGQFCMTLADFLDTFQGVQVLNLVSDHTSKILRPF